MPPQPTTPENKPDKDRLTDSYIKKLTPPEKGSRIVYDAYEGSKEAVAGFGIRITAAGARAFILNYRTESGRERRYTIGSFPDWQSAAARERAKGLKQRIDQGEDPLADIEAEREAPTVAELCDRFEAEHLPRKRPGTAADYRNILKNHVHPHFGKHIKVVDVEFKDVDRLHRKISETGHHHRANRVVAVLSKMFSLAIKWKMRTDNPCKGIERNAETKRKRYLSGEELARLTQALAGHDDRQAANIIRLLLLTGARRGEVLSARWADLDLVAGTWSKPASSTKQNQDHVVPLSAPARQLFAEIYKQTKGKEFVFPSHGDSGHRVSIKSNWHAICAAAEITRSRASA
jgi:integrase